MRDKERKICNKKTIEKMPTNENGKMMLQKIKMVKNFYRVCGYRKWGTFERERERAKKWWEIR